MTLISASGHHVACPADTGFTIVGIIQPQSYRGESTGNITYTVFILVLYPTFLHHECRLGVDKS